MPKHQESIRTREQAAARLLDLNGHLSSSRFIHRTLDQRPTRPVVAELTAMLETLSSLGYEADSSAHKFVSSALSTFTTSSSDSITPVSTRILTARFLLDAALSLSTYAPPLDLRLPTEVLYLILDYVKLDTDPKRRRNTLYSLRATSTLWRKIALPTSKSQLIITSPREFNAGFANNRYRKAIFTWSELELLHIDLSMAECGCNFEPIENWKLDHQIRVKHLMLDLQVEKHERPEDYEGWYWWATELVNTTKSYSLFLSASSKQDYILAMDLFGDSATHSEDRMELHLGQSPIALPTDTVEDRLDKLEARCLEDIDTNWWALPYFTLYAVLSTPWLAFTAPSFLLEIIDTRTPLPELILPTSRLEHVELTLEFDPSDPVEVGRQVNVFFTTISPKLEILAIRLRLTGPHPSHLDKVTFTDQFYAGLRSCKRLRYLELGGFGLDDDYLDRLAILPIDTLILLPLLPPPSLGRLIDLLGSTSTQDFSTLEVLEVQVSKTEFDDTVEPRLQLRQACKAKGIKLEGDDGWPNASVSSDYGIMSKLAEEAGVV